MVIQVVPPGGIGLDEARWAVRDKLAPPERYRYEGGGFELLNWSTAGARIIIENMVDGRLTALFRDPTTGEKLAVPGEDWGWSPLADLRLVGDQAPFGEGPMAKYDGLKLYLDRGEFDEWIEALPLDRPIYLDDMAGEIEAANGSLPRGEALSKILSAFWNANLAKLQMSIGHAFQLPDGTVYATRGWETYDRQEMCISVRMFTFSDDGDRALYGWSDDRIAAEMTRLSNNPDIIEWRRMLARYAISSSDIHAVCRALGWAVPGCINSSTAWAPAERFANEMPVKIPTEDLDYWQGEACMAVVKAMDDIGERGGFERLWRYVKAVAGGRPKFGRAALEAHLGPIVKEREWNDNEDGTLSKFNHSAACAALGLRPDDPNLGSYAQPTDGERPSPTTHSPFPNTEKSSP